MTKLRVQAKLSPDDGMQNQPECSGYDRAEEINHYGPAVSCRAPLLSPASAVCRSGAAQRVTTLARLTHFLASRLGY